MNWARKGNALISGDWYISGNRVCGNLVYQLYQGYDIMGTYATADEAKDAAEAMSNTDN
jgi:hypothetical protein